MEMKSFVHDFLRSEILGKNLAEIKKGSAKNPEDWWTNLPGKMKRKVCDILGLSKGKDIADFGSFDDGEQDELSAYFKKHGGLVEGFEEYFEEKKILFPRIGDRVQFVSSGTWTLDNGKRIKVEKGDIGEIKKFIGTIKSDGSWIAEIKLPQGKVTADWLQAELIRGSKEEDLAEGKLSDSSEWKNIEKAAKEYNMARHKMDLAIAKLAVMKRDKDDHSTYVQDAIRKLREQFNGGKEIDLGY
jgi:hypothetical protein